MPTCVEVYFMLPSCEQTITDVAAHLSSSSCTGTEALTDGVRNGEGNGVLSVTQHQLCFNFMVCV